jgi:hypothetical protein
MLNIGPTEIIIIGVVCTLLCLGVVVAMGLGYVIVQFAKRDKR